MSTLTLARRTRADRGMDRTLLRASSTAALDADLRRFGANRHLEADDVGVTTRIGRPWPNHRPAATNATTDSALRLLGEIAAASG